MIINQVIKKTNIITDGNLPDSAILTEKLANVIYFNYEKEGSKFQIPIKELCHQLGISNQTKNHMRVKDSLTILKQPMELRDFNDAKGKQVKWYIGSFLLRAKVMKDTSDYVNIELDEDLIAGMKQHKTYTEIDIAISNKFKTKYGITIWQMYLRYKNAPRDKVSPDITYQMFSIEDLNKKFGTNYKYNSDILKCINRGLKEIRKITDKDIAVKWQNNIKKFGFFWRKEIPKSKYKTDRHEFIKYIRKNHVNDFLLAVTFEQNNLNISVNPKGNLYDQNQNTKLTAIKSNKIWDYLFKNQNQIIVLGQQKMVF
jgi:hypothetical protein